MGPSAKGRSEAESQASISWANHTLKHKVFPQEFEGFSALRVTIATRNLKPSPTSTQVNSHPHAKGLPGGKVGPFLEIKSNLSKFLQFYQDVQLSRKNEEADE